MTVVSAEPEFDVRRWDHLVSLLSMDVVRPFFDLMGLKLASPAQFQEVLRREVITGRKRGVVVPNARLPVTPQGVLKAVGESLGERVRRHLVWWGQGVFHKTPGRDGRNLQKWSTVLQTSRHEPGLWNRLSFPQGALDRFHQSFNFDDYRQRQAEVDARPLCDWDLHLYTLHLHDDNLYGPNDLTRVPDGPRLWVKPTIWDYQGYQFWAWVLNTLPSDRLDLLWKAGREIVEEEGLTSARGLPHPSILEIGL